MIISTNKNKFRKDNLVLTCMLDVTVVRLVCAADTAVALMTWLERVAIVPRVVMGVARVALALARLPPAKLVETVPVTVPRVVTPWKEDRHGEREIL